jgi:Rrf2 family protein
MRLSTRTRYGSRALAELAAAYPGQVLSLKDVAKNQHLSVKYLEHIMTTLRVAGLVRPVRGMRGGYTLTRPPGRITLREVFETLEGSLAPVDCVDDPQSCPLKEVCPTRETWVEIKNSLAKILEGTTLQDLLARKKRRELRARKA